jgi:sugar transferase EpsL
MKQAGWRLTAKRMVDWLLSVSALLVLAPLMLVGAMTVLALMGRPVLYRQWRPGRNGKPFKLLKFRTMLDTKDNETGPLTDGKRLTRVGRFLRSTSIDELPQLWNVLRGDLSLVGPRPLRMEYLQRYNTEQARRHDVFPGITGWAQINGRNALEWQEKFNYDVWYVDNWSLWLDIRILWGTLLRVTRREGVSHGEQPTMPEFVGNKAACLNPFSQNAAVDCLPSEKR